MRMHNRLANDLKWLSYLATRCGRVNKSVFTLMYFRRHEHIASRRKFNVDIKRINIISPSRRCGNIAYSNGESSSKSITMALMREGISLGDGLIISSSASLCSWGRLRDKCCENNSPLFKRCQDDLLLRYFNIISKHDCKMMAAYCRGQRRWRFL